MESEHMRLLRDDIAQKQAELDALKQQLADAQVHSTDEKSLQRPSDKTDTSYSWPLRPEEYERYGRQMILPGFGIQGQLRLHASSVLVIGAGGLGCPAAAYLAGSGVGVLGLVDGDTVEASNLHRQIAHATARVGEPKVESALAYLKQLNPLVTYRPYVTHLTPQNAEEIISPYDLVLDCTDHPTSRYLISDACVLLGKPLVSASAFRTDGQLIVLNHPAAPQGDLVGGPCYRCVFPKPPPPESVVSCGEGGILGPVVGTMGVLQAMEAIKLISSGALETSERGSTETKAGPASSPSLLIFSGQAAVPFRSVRMRGRRKNCFACGASSTLTLESLRDGLMDYVAFCGINLPVNVLEPEERVSVTDYLSVKEQSHVLLDVREKELFDIGKIDGAINVPVGKLLGGDSRQSLDGEKLPQPEWLPPELPASAPIYVVCRVGNDSQLVTKKLKDMGLENQGARFVGDIKGGMRAWRDEVDSTMPFL